MGSRWLSSTALIGLSLASSVMLRGAQPPSAPPTPPAKPGATTRLDKAEVTRLATDVRAKLPVELPEGVDLSLWASDELLVDPVAIDLDADGTLYVTSSMRNNMPLDIRQHQDWMATVHTLRSMADLRAFYRKLMAPANSG